jgi:hypothetical protein
VFAKCTRPEIEHYISANARALKQVLAQGADYVLANHLLLAPAIAARACSAVSGRAAVPYDIKVRREPLESRQ